MGNRCSSKNPKVQIESKNPKTQIEPKNPKVQIESTAQTTDEYMNARGYEGVGFNKPFIVYLPRELARANNAQLLKEKIAREKREKSMLKK